ncbi:NLI interacting factor-like phosphatase (macronuclear) [Tetrahymena thermophila SB210]|uniref:NLI interacting factor-like phosphatase n=1 Tax=Tetrahymena thermophila (strain SB210) TaxID=312017 RepID=Q22WR0_TETTS|nr:NLI interacting factor-like phosphatase [Tetrahymena thermophila SB210]EAR89732.2 NLI interacting factor-like phosphatase [Tetrahymena thermophila SB210]|eukprot:XP_001009977.2 NLI interacting factor-like phosphatase [Tetrahymena thermophila SB210]
MSDITFQADQANQSYVMNLPCSCNLIEGKLPSENNLASDNSSETSSGTRVAQDFNTLYKDTQKEKHQLIKTKREKVSSNCNQNCNFQKDSKTSNGLFQNISDGDYKRPEDQQILNSSLKEDQSQLAEQKTTSKTTNQEIQNIKMKCIQSIQGLQLNKKRKQNEVSTSSLSQQKEDINNILDKNENQNCLNKLKVEDLSLPRKVLKTNISSNQPATSEEDISKINQIQDSYQQNLCQPKNSQQIRTYNQTQNLPHSVSSIEDSEESFSSENIELDQEALQKQNVNKPLLQQGLAGEIVANDDQNVQNRDILLSLINKVKKSFKQKIQQIHDIRDETKIELGQILNQIQTHCNQSDLGDKAEKEVQSDKFNQLIDKANSMQLLNKNGSLEEKDVKLCQLIHKIVSQDDIQTNENQDALHQQLIEVQSQLSSDYESMECREESISDLVQPPNFNSNSIQIQAGQQLSESVSSSDDSALNNDDQELENHENDKYIFISDTEEQSDNQIKFDSSQYENDYILILDLDNTLVHSYMGGPSILGKGDPTVNKIETHVNQQKLYIKRRPYLKEFFEVAFKNFKVVMYTLGSLGYAKAVYYLLKKEYPEIFSQYGFLKIIAQNTQKTTAYTAVQQISSPQVAVQQNNSQPQLNNNSNSDSESNQQLQKNCDSQQNPSLQQPVYTNKYLKNISKYFPPEKFSKRLLIFDDNSRVYEQSWWKNAIFTKPYYFWLNNNNSISTSSDSFLYFAAELLKRILRHTQRNTIDLPLIYQLIRRQLLHKCKFFILNDNPERENLEELIKELGGSIIPKLYERNQIKQNQQQKNSKINEDKTKEEEITLPNYIILSELSEANVGTQKFAFNHGIKIVSSDWIKYCFLLNFKVSSDIFILHNYTQYQQSQNYPNLETDLVNQFILHSQAQNNLQKQ